MERPCSLELESAPVYRDFNLRQVVEQTIGGERRAWALRAQPGSPNAGRLVKKAASARWPVRRARRPIAPLGMGVQAS
jgi:hypothetical protein